MTDTYTKIVLERDRGLLVSDCGAANLTECQRAIRARMRWKPSGACHVRLIQ
jgi:hypothetical protein